MERKIIYLDDAIDALRYAQHRFTVADEAGGMGTVKWSEDVIYFATAERVLAELPSAQPEPQWIPCSERLPEDVEIGEEYPTVIFCTKDNVYVGFYEYYLGGRWWAAEDYTVDKVIAWMPLPEPYKEGADE